jgi:hypothetical protein
VTVIGTGLALPDDEDAPLVDVLSKPVGSLQAVRAASARSEDQAKARECK